MDDQVSRNGQVGRRQLLFRKSKIFRVGDRQLAEAEHVQAQRLHGGRSCLTQHRLGPSRQTEQHGANHNTRSGAMND
jgi:hypothetical protein